MNRDDENYLAMYQSTQAYLKLSTEYCAHLGGIRWSGEDDALAYPDGRFFAFCAPIAEFLEGFSTGGRVIPFSCVLHWADLLQNLREHLSPAVRRLRYAFQETSDQWRNAGALAAVLSADVPEPAEPPRIDHVCRRLRDRAFPIRWFIARFHESALGPAEVPAIAPEEFERRVIERLAAYSDDDLRSWLQNGRGPVHEAGAALACVQPPPPRTLMGVLAALLLRPRLAGAETYVTRLVGALTLPPRRLAPQELPVGGYADMTTRGAVEHILPSQHALDELEFLRRFAERELLFFRREEPPAQNRQEIAILIDQGVRTWGDVRLVLAAAALALGKQCAGRAQQFRFAGTSNAGRLLDPLEADVEALGELIEASDLSFDPGAALETVLEQPCDALRDVVLLTHPRNLREPDVLVAARRAGPRDRVFAVALDEEGAAAMSEIRHGAPVLLRQFRVEFVAAQPAPPSTTPDEPLKPFAAWTGNVEPIPCPFRFGTSGRITHFAFDHGGQRLLTVSAGDMLHLWGLHGDEREVLPRPMLEGMLLRNLRIVIGVTGGFVLAGIHDALGVYTAHYDVLRRRCHARYLGPATSVLHAHYIPAFHALRLVTNDLPDGAVQGYCLDLATGAIAPESNARPGLRQAFEDLDRNTFTHRKRLAATASPGWVFTDAPAEFAYRLDTVTGTITYQYGIDDGEFVPLADGKPLLRGATISVGAQAAGDVLAVMARLHDATLRLLLFRRSTGATICERRFDPRIKEQRRFLLSPDGNWLAREWGTRVIVEKIDAPAMQITTRSGGYNSEGQLDLGEQCFLLSFGQRHWHLVRWSGARVEFSYESKAAKDAFRNAAFQDVMRRSPLSVARAASASAPSSYDPQRFVAICMHGGLGFFLDCYGQVAVRETTGKLLCMFMAFRDRLAAWLPDGSRCGTAALGLGPETPGARAKLAQVLHSGGKGG